MCIPPFPGRREKFKRNKQMHFQQQQSKEVVLANRTKGRVSGFIGVVQTTCCSPPSLRPENGEAKRQTTEEDDFLKDRLHALFSIYCLIVCVSNLCLWLNDGTQQSAKQKGFVIHFAKFDFLRRLCCTIFFLQECGHCFLQSCSQIPALSLSV